MDRGKPQQTHLVMLPSIRHELGLCLSALHSNNNLVVQVFSFYERFCEKIGEEPLSSYVCRWKMYEVAAARLISVDWKDKTLSQKVMFSDVDEERYRQAFSDDIAVKQLL